MSTTATFRDYNADLPEDGEFSVNTSDVAHAEIVMDINGVRLSDKLTPTAARDMGTFLVRSAERAGESDCEFIGTMGRAFRLSAYDFGDIDFALCADGEEGDTFVEFTLSTEQAIDLGQRLIVWAGVNVQESVDA
ncbi:hypothetical protein A9W98_17940 [Mycobacterium gordonae]|uniref:Uncharacterized protein n=1 Tax=Mycobacterium gordonae TaxID=1778 RepID=A0A1A6BHQ6_MYCGO|nr:hypothetical protein [Mycobacterium gordonae]OBS01865.1 hypothetical protein A9W98_17940 [Mycobacterium gordonae]